MSAKERSKVKLKNLEEEFFLLQEKNQFLRHAMTLETDAASKFSLEHQIAENEKRITSVEAQINGIESVGSDKGKDAPHPSLPKYEIHIQSANGLIIGDNSHSNIGFYKENKNER